MDIRKMLGVAAVGLAVAMVGCGDDDDDNGPPDDADVENGLDALPPLMSDGVSAEYGCLGERTAFEGNEDSTFTLEVRDFQTGAAVEGACVNFYPDNVVPADDECGGDNSGVTDADGNVEFTNPDGGWFAYRLFAIENETLGVVQVNVATPEDEGAAEGNSVSEDTADTIPLLLGRDRADGRAVFSGALYDCNGDTVEGAAIRVVRDGEVIQEGPDDLDPMYAYFGGGADPLPSGAQEYTNVNGLYLGLNIPVETEGETVQLVACGKPDGENLEVLGCEETRSFADTVNILSLEPTRADGPDCPDVCN